MTAPARRKLIDEIATNACAAGTFVIPETLRNVSKLTKISCDIAATPSDRLFPPAASHPTASLLPRSPAKAPAQDRSAPFSTETEAILMQM
ncbi:hypothetical protein QRQ56_06950 [Bradyrhizobium sp. U531]|uniref:hypothetical protein n=1 Tax=Bradyrhizobium sp. U531 TaxID=3053458 RepID=UPI003F41D286